MKMHNIWERVAELVGAAMSRPAEPPASPVEPQAIRLITEVSPLEIGVAIFKESRKVAMRDDADLDPIHSIVDLLKSLGLDSSFSARTILWADLGMRGAYEGGEQQNTDMMAVVRSILEEPDLCDA